MPKPILHLVYSTNWKYQPGQNFNMTLEEWNKELKKCRTVKARNEFVGYMDRYQNCCDMTKPYFVELMVRQAREMGFEVIRYPIRGKEDWLAVGKAAASGEMAPGAAALLFHAWHGTYEKECVPAWDFYPVIDAVKARHHLIYPHPDLDQLHSEKRYMSALMPPTQFVHCVRHGDGWKVRGKGNKSVEEVVAAEVRQLKVKAKAKGLPFKDIMVKQGLSWGGYAVSRQAAGAAKRFIAKKMLPKIPKMAQKVTVLLQAKLDLVSELRWVMVDGKLRGKEWKSLMEPKKGGLAVDAGYQCKYKATRDVAKFAKQMRNQTLEQLEDSMAPMAHQVYAEAIKDCSKGEKPLYLRVDLLLDKQARLWLGERESWGADLNGNDEWGKMDPTYVEICRKMLTRAKDAVGKRAPRKVKTSAVVKKRSALGIRKTIGKTKTKRSRTA